MAQAAGNPREPDEAVLERLPAAIMDASPAAVYVKDVEGHYILVNRHWETLLDIPREQAKEKTDYDIFPKDTADSLRKNDREVFQSGSGIEREENVVLGGRPRTYLSVKFPIRDRSGSVLALCGISTDITGIRRTEEDLRKAHEELEARIHERTYEVLKADAVLQAESEERRRAELKLSSYAEHFRSLLDNALDIIAVVEAHGNIRYVSPSVERVLGYTPEDRIGESIYSLMHPEDAPHVRDTITSVLRSPGGTATVEFRYRHRDGAWRHIEAIGRNLLDSPTVRGIVINARDMTVHKLAEKALRESEAELRRSHEELRALAARLLTVEEEDRGRVARELHDDLNQQLAIVAFEIDSLARELPPSPDEIRERLRSLEQQVAELSKDVRRMAHQLHPSILDDLGLAPALRSFCADFSRREGIRVTFTHRNLPAPLPQDLAVCLYRVVQEGLRNVARHSRTKRAVVSVRGTGTEIRLRISDPGAGFDRAAVKGGLGIISMEERARLVGGTISVRSEPGRGTQIEVHVPVSGRSS
jgi:PAS domain S-box-containing protein